MNDSYVLETLAKLIGVVTLSGLIWGIFRNMLGIYGKAIFQALPHLEVLPKGPGYLDWVLLCFCEFL